MLSFIMIMQKSAKQNQKVLHNFGNKLQHSHIRSKNNRTVELRTIEQQNN